MAKSKKVGIDPLVGKFFHQIEENDKLGWQGIIESVVSKEPKRYLVQLFNWIDGDKSSQKIVEFTDMLRWVFYDSSEAMKYGYEDYARRHGFRYNAAEDIEFCEKLYGKTKT